jgi:uncharacterized protein YeaO (DUF488 family)
MTRTRPIIRIKRVYEEPSPDDGFRVLVDRLWPRGLTRERAQADVWLKEIAPSTALRLWFRHDPRLWEEFRRRYKAELAANTALDDLRVLVRGRKRATLLYGAKVTDHNHAIVLREAILRGKTRTRSLRI